MAKKTISQYFSDLSGDEIKTESPTVSFSFDGSGYEVDLTESEKATLADFLAPYIEAGRKAGRASSPRAPRSTNGPEPKAVREWAREQEIDVPARGRIPLQVIEAYEKAH